MEISYAIRVTFVNLAETLIFDSLLNRFAIHLRVESELNGINDVFIELRKRYIPAIGLYGELNMLVDILVGDKSSVVVVSHKKIKYLPC